MTTLEQPKFEDLKVYLLLHRIAQELLSEASCHTSIPNAKLRAAYAR
jgi:hypothetical protein